ncbi:MAG: hypothetical protein J5545_06280 [Bacteroidaceae bacterium]|nr:hypothetical protein [Bacteroidaceae bacterium]
MKKFFLLAIALFGGILSSQAQNSPYEGSVAAAGDFFIYNVESGYWLQNNNRKGDWNSQVELDPEGFDWELIALDGGTWQLNPKFGNNHSLNSDADNGYMDTGRPVSAWTLTPVEGVSNGYTISSNGTTLGTNADKFLIKNAEGSAAIFQLVTAAERLAVQQAKYAEVSGSNPMDLTWMIPGANMNIADEHADALVKVVPEKAAARFVTGQTNVNPGNGVREIWSNDGGAYDIGYKLTGLPDGVYRFTVSGYYRDGSCDNTNWTGVIGQKHKEGTEEIRPVIYLNDKTQPILSICAPELTAAAHGCNRSSAGIFVPDNTGQASEATAAGLYLNKTMKIVISDGIIDLGVRATDGVGDDWLILDKFQLVYYGPDNLPSYLALLQAAIDEAEAWDASNTSTALADALDEAVSAGKATLTSDDTDEVEAATEAIKAALNAAKAIDVSILKATMVLAESEGVDVTAVSDVIANATNSGEVSSALDALRIARKINALGGAPDIYTGSVPTADKEYYFFNLGTGMWLSAGSDWNTHAAVDQAGWLFKLNESGEGFTITSSMGSFNNTPYVDTGANTVYTFQAVEGKEGVYNILEGEDLLGYNPDGKTDGKKYWSSVSNVAGADATDANYQWKLVTKEERDALLSTGAVDNPVDATYFINNPSLLRKPGYNMWEKVVNGGNGGARVSSQTDGNDDRAADYGYEYWNCDNFKFSQSLTDLKRGLYVVSVQGFWREGDGSNQANIVNNGGELKQKAYVFANGEQAPLPNIASYLDFVPGVGTAVTDNGNFPNWPREAFEYFETGAFTASVQVVVGSDHKLTLGVGVDEKVAYGDWVVFDNFRLAYLGSDVDINLYLSALTEALNAAKEFDASTTTANLAEALEEAVAAGELLLDSDDPDELDAATVAIKEALEAAKAVNVVALRQTIVLAEKEGIVVEEAKEVSENATTAAEVDDMLFQLRAARKVLALGGAPDIYTGSEPAAGEFYFFNLGTGMWLNQGSDWCTHAAVDQAGLLVTFEESEDGEGFIFRTPWGSFNNSPYTDTGAQTVYKFQAVEGKKNVYNILEGEDLMGWNPYGKTDGKKYWSSVSNVAGADPADPCYQWKIVSKAERDALLATATPDDPVDATYLIGNASLMRQPGYDMWIKEVDGGNGGARVSSQTDGDGNRAADFGWEVWNSNSFKFYQKLENLPAGIYEISVQGFWREGDGGNQARIVNEGGELNQLAYLYANDEAELLPNIASCPDFVPGVGTAVTNYGNFPNWPAEAFEYFETGAYKTSVEVFVPGDGKLTIGVGVDEKAEVGDWVVFDNFRLLYLGPVVETVDVTVTDAGYATFVAPFEAEVPEGVTAYYVEVKTDGVNLELTEVNPIPANSPVVLKAAPGDYIFSGNLVGEVEYPVAGDLVGTYEDIEAPFDCHVLQNQDGVVGFYQVLDVQPTVKANHAYLTAPVFDDEVKVYHLGDTATGIQMAESENAPAVIYNLAGQRLNRAQKGIFIVNGKKEVK